MRMSQIVLVPCLSAKNPGKTWYRYSEWDALRGYLDSLVEHLEESRVSYKVLKEGDIIDENSLVIFCHGGWSSAKTPPVQNASTITYGSAPSKIFAERLKESVHEWGKCYVDLGHKIMNFALDETICKTPNTISISFSPFKLNAPHAESYLQRLPDLGRIIESCIFAYLIARGEVAKMGGRVIYD